MDISPYKTRQEYNNAMDELFKGDLDVLNRYPIAKRLRQEILFRKHYWNRFTEDKFHFIKWFGKWAKRRMEEEVYSSYRLYYIKEKDAKVAKVFA